MIWAKKMTEHIGGNVKYKKLVQSLAMAGIMMLGYNSQAVELGGVEMTGSGFLTLGAGKMLGGTKHNVNDYNCPCFTADYAQGGVYDNRGGLQFNPDSKLGLQGSAFFDNRRFSLTAQAVSRGAQDGKVNLEWLYASYKINEKFTVQAGRKRLPMFYYSDTQDIGVALPFAHLPPQLYGWEAVNYNGANLTYQDQWGAWTTNADLVLGNESKKDTGYWKIYNGRQSRTDIKWNNIVGGDLSLSKDWLETRLVYLQSNNKAKTVSGIWDATTSSYDPTNIDTDYRPPIKQRIYGITVNADYNNWLLRSEAIQIDHPSTLPTYKDLAYIVGGGYRYGKWQPMLTWSRYKAVAIGEGSVASGQEGHYTIAWTLRYDISTSSDIKVQLDDQHDMSGPNYAAPYGNARLLTVTYDMVF
jgi:hypothetical protein